MATPSTSAVKTTATTTTTRTTDPVLKVIQLLESLHAKVDAMPSCECNTLRQELAEVKKLMSQSSTIVSTPPPTDITYSVVKRAVTDATTYAEKAVWVGLPEFPSPHDTTAADQKSIEELCKELGDKTINKALEDGQITHKRHPEVKGERKNRIMKIKFESQKTRDLFLSLVRSSRPPTVTKTSGKFIRRDLCPFELELARQARIDAWINNINLGALVYGVRDEKLIRFTGTPRPLPDGYDTRPPRGYNPVKSQLNGALPIDTSSRNQSNATLNAENSVLSSLTPIQQKTKTSAASHDNGEVQA